MEPSDYSVVKSDNFKLVRRIGRRILPLVSDSRAEIIHAIYQKICNREYASERELFEDIYSRYSDKSIVQVFAP